VPENNSDKSIGARRNLYLLRGLTLAWAGLIFYLSTGTFGTQFSASLLAKILAFLHVSVSPMAFHTLHTLVRKLAHFTEYAIFSVLLYLNFLPYLRSPWRTRAAIWAISIAAAYSLTDEFHQLFVPGRTASLRDSGLDSLGAVFGIFVIYWEHRLFWVKDSSPRTNAESRH
jgi:VanZ family protein